MQIFKCQRKTFQLLLLPQFLHFIFQRKSIKIGILDFADVYNLAWVKLHAPALKKVKSAFKKSG
jgi:hypothetical protein